jgi:hypothetical protein
MTTKITEKNVSNLANAGIQWQAVITADGSTTTTAVAGRGYLIDTTSATHTVNLPSSPNLGDTVAITDYSGTSDTNAISINPNGSKLLGGTGSRNIQTSKETVILFYSDTSKGWVVSSGYKEGTLGLVGVPSAPTIGTISLSGSDIIVPFTAPTETGDSPILSYTATSSPGGVTGTISEDGSTRSITVTGLSVGTQYTFTITATNAVGTSAASSQSNAVTTPNPSFISATGGTITTVDTDYKVHTFTGDGCFVVSTAGLQVGCCGGPSDVDYLVIAGGGGGGQSFGGGGGAGGYRESHCATNSGPYTASPLATPTSITVSAATYPITVGAGGAGKAPGVAEAQRGSNSIFATITSTGGGGGPGTNPCGTGPGGSGSGGGHQGAGGTGNTPPVSPSQGNPGGMNNLQSPPTPNAGRFGAAGGGGAGAAGTQATCAGYNSTSGPGGAGVATSITGSPVTRAGGGGGGEGYATSAGSGGPGGGGNGQMGGTVGTAGSANTGGGGGGGGGTAPGGGAGGKGLVVIRYKFQ